MILFASNKAHAFIATFVVIICSSIVGSLAAEPLSETAAVEIALQNNPDLKAALYIVDQAKAKLTQAGLFPNPEIEISNSSDQFFNNEGEYGFSSGINQKFPISGRLSKASDLARVDVALAEAEIKNQRRILSAEVLKLYRQQLIIGEKLRYNSEFKRNLSELLRISEKRFKVAELSQVDLNLEKIELEKLNLNKASYEIEDRQVKIELNRLLGRIPESSLELKGELLKDLNNDYLEKASLLAINQRPDRALIALSIDRAKQEKRLASAERWEDWTLGIEFSEDKGVFDDPIGNKNDSFIGFRVSIPLPLWNQNQGKIAEAGVNESQAQAQLVALDIRIAAEVAASKAKLTSLMPVLRQLESQSLNLAQANLNTVQKSYSEGLLEITSVLQALQQLYELQQRYIESLSNFTEEYTNFELVTASFKDSL